MRTQTTADGRFKVRTDEDGIVYVRVRLCGAKYIELDGSKKGDEFYCDREEGHMPSLWHRNRDNSSLWYKDRG